MDEINEEKFQSVSLLVSPWPFVSTDDWTRKGRCVPLSKDRMLKLFALEGIISIYGSGL